jgi:hypothetical protein
MGREEFAASEGAAQLSLGGGEKGFAFMGSTGTPVVL